MIAPIYFNFTNTEHHFHFTNSQDDTTRTDQTTNTLPCEVYRRQRVPGPIQGIY